MPSVAEKMARPVDAYDRRPVTRGVHRLPLVVAERRLEVEADTQ
jgi:hypothetical protein